MVITMIHVFVELFIERGIHLRCLKEFGIIGKFFSTGSWVECSSPSAFFSHVPVRPAATSYQSFSHNKLWALKVKNPILIPKAVL